MPNYLNPMLILTLLTLTLRWNCQMWEVQWFPLYPHCRLSRCCTIVYMKWYYFQKLIFSSTGWANSITDKKMSVCYQHGETKAKHLVRHQPSPALCLAYCAASWASQPITLLLILWFIVFPECCSLQPAVCLWSNCRLLSNLSDLLF